MNHPEVVEEMVVLGEGHPALTGRGQALVLAESAHALLGQPHTISASYYTRSLGKLRSIPVLTN